MKCAIVPLAVLATALMCVVCSCSDDECDPCSVKCPPDPEERLLGVWIIFETYRNGVPEQSWYGMEFEFLEEHAAVILGDTVDWYVDDDLVILLHTGLNDAALLGEYFFEADTLNMDFTDENVLFRMLPEDLYVPPSLLKTPVPSNNSIPTEIDASPHDAIQPDRAPGGCPF